jgi:hypothetical protein
MRVKDGNEASLGGRETSKLQIGKDSTKASPKGNLRELDILPLIKFDLRLTLVATVPKS